MSDPGDGPRFRTQKGSERDDKHGLPADVNPIESNVRAVKDTERPLIITEGAAKADAIISALIREGRAGRQDAGVVSLTGVGMAVEAGRDGMPDFLHPKTLGSKRWIDLLRGRDVVIAYDGDFATKGQVASSLRRLAAVLTRVGVERVRIIDLSGITDDELPERLHGSKVGIDDYLRACEEVGGAERPMSALLRAAGPWDSIDRKLVRKKLLSARPQPGDLCGIWLEDALDEWLDDASDEAKEEITWAKDDADNAYVRATGEAGHAYLGAWTLTLPKAIAKFVTSGDQHEAFRIVRLLAERGDLDEAGGLLAGDYESLIDALGVSPSAELDLRDLSLRAAVESVRSGGLGITIPLTEDFRGGYIWRTVAEIGKDAKTHGIFEIAEREDAPPIRRQLLPYVLTKWAIQRFARVSPDLDFEIVGDETRFVSAAILPGGRIEEFDGLTSDTDASPKALVRGLKGRGVAIREPITKSEEVAAAYCLEIVGATERQDVTRVDRMGWVRLPGGHAWVSTYGSVTAEGISDHVSAQRGPDKKSNASLRYYERSIGFDEVATDEELPLWVDLLEDLLELAPDRVSIPLTGQFLRSFIPMGAGSSTATVACVAPPGAMKSALIARYGHLMSSMSSGAVKNIAIDRDTTAAVENAMPFLAHQIVIADDYRPSSDRDSEKRQASNIDRLVSGGFDSDASQKALANGENRVARDFLGSPVTSAETTFGSQTSRLERQLTIRMTKGDVVPDRIDAFSEKWIKTGVGRRLVARYLRGIARALDADRYRPQAAGFDLLAMEDRLVQSFRLASDRPVLAAVQVVSGIVHFLAVMHQEVCDAEKDGLDVPYEYHERVAALSGDFWGGEVAKQIIDYLARDQYEEQEDAGAGSKILTTISDGIASGDFYLADHDGDVPPNPAAFGYVQNGPQREWLPRHGSILLGRVSRDGDKALLLVAPLDRVRDRVGERLTKSDLKSRLAPFLAKGYENRGGEKISGLTTNAGKVFPMRGYVVDLSSLGIDSVEPY